MDLEREEWVLPAARRSLTYFASKKSQWPEPFEVTRHDEGGCDLTEEITM